MLTIGLVNNMSPAAIESTERQFDTLLTAAARGIPYEIRYFRLLGARPSYYERMEDLWASRVDGLIVTGAEPKTDALPDEPFWQPLTRTIDWAMHHTSSTIWSCLAAHAAVLHLDGVQRQPHAEKIFGVFTSEKTADHPILHDVQPVWGVPHSRWNDLPETDLTASGYTVLAKSPDAGVDAFLKHCGNSLFLFFQSHPEYDAHILMREYRRDVARFLSGRGSSYPNVPRNYFQDQIAGMLEDMRQEALQRGTVAGLDMLDRADLPYNWNPVAVQLYRNWLGHLLTMQS